MKSKIWTDGLKQLQDLLKPGEGKIGIAFEFIDAQVLNKFESYIFPDFLVFMCPPVSIKDNVWWSQKLQISRISFYLPKRLYSYWEQASAWRLYLASMLVPSSSHSLESTDLWYTL